MKKAFVWLAAAGLVMLPSATQVTNTIPVLYAQETTKGYVGGFNNTSISFDLNASNGDQSLMVEAAVLDTGAYTTTVPGYIADQLNLPHGTPAKVLGIGGTQQGYMSHIDLTISGQTYKDVTCVVIPNFTSFLLGADFFRDNHLKLDADFGNNTFTLTPEKQTKK